MQLSFGIHVGITVICHIYNGPDTLFLFSGIGCLNIYDFRGTVLIQVCQTDEYQGVVDTVSTSDKIRVFADIARIYITGSDQICTAVTVGERVEVGVITFGNFGKNEFCFLAHKIPTFL